MPAETSNRVRCTTTKGAIDITLMPEWSPIGTFRFVELVESGFFQDIPLFRCVENFLCQFGYKESKPGYDGEWSTIADDPKGQSTPGSFKAGYVSFAGNGKNSRNSHLFVTLGENVRSLGKEPWETPIGFVTESTMPIVKKWYTAYGDMPPWGQGPDPSRIARKGGMKYLQTEFPGLDYIKSCEIVKQSKTGVRYPQVELMLGPNLGRVVMELNTDWSKEGIARFEEIVETRYLDEARFFRVVPNFVVQFGLPADPARGREFRKALPDEAVATSNVRGTISFATSGPNTRTTQLFINLGDNGRLDGMGFSPIGRIIEGMDLIDQINSEYREQPDQGKITQYGNEYLNKEFPRLSFIKTARIISPSKFQTDANISEEGAVKSLRTFDETENQQGSLVIPLPLIAFIVVLIAIFALIRRRSPSVSSRKVS